MQRSRRDALRSVLLAAAVLAGLVAVRSSVTPDPEDRTVPFRQGDHTVLVANRRSATFPTSPPWTRPSGRSSPRSTWTSCAARPMGVFINDIAPERAAQLLRDAH